MIRHRRNSSTSALFSTYYVVGNYKAFKEGVAEICQDANDFGYYFCDKFRGATGIVRKQVSKQTVELETPGKLRRVLRTDNQLEPNAVGEGALGEIDALVVVGDATADDGHVHNFELGEQCILIRHAGAHGIDHVHAHDHLLRTCWCNQ
jgi:hypothetical protein